MSAATSAPGEKGKDFPGSVPAGSEGAATEETLEIPIDFVVEE